MAEVKIRNPSHFGFTTEFCSVDSEAHSIADKHGDDCKAFIVHSGEKLRVEAEFAVHKAPTAS